MKKSNFIYFSGIICIAFIMLSFIPKNESNLKSSENKFGNYINVLVVYPSNINAQQRSMLRNCFISNISRANLISYNQCTNNPNAEILYIYIDDRTKGVTDSDNAEDQEILQATPVTDFSLNIAASNCGIITASKYLSCNDLNSNGPSGFQSPGGQ
ncbi:hypothetical protein DS884_09100 [Tenacibaculum sp. E3R01]|uniref:hypothetical protein n=1 Tax=Tenacibaculum sp. E3R01 TaxID=2267227 RepID=UPI000DEA1580|nr:hypothetical protein [Tenacibaculum sp. E3R01]RBW58021.1 hypothetical protein DS884_09100 [Tenacibaculum sp. E3R01]